MKKFSLLFLAILCAAFLGGCDKKSENLAKCSDTTVLQELKDAIVKEFEPFCKKGKEWVEYCNAQKGDFDKSLIETDGVQCQVPFIGGSMEEGWIIGYTTQYENGKLKVTMLDYMAY